MFGLPRLLSSPEKRTGVRRPGKRGIGLSGCNLRFLSLSRFSETCPLHLPFVERKGSRRKRRLQSVSEYRLNQKLWPFLGGCSQISPEKWRSSFARPSSPNEDRGEKAAEDEGEKGSTLTHSLIRVEDKRKGERWAKAKQGNCFEERANMPTSSKDYMAPIAKRSERSRAE